MAYQLQSIDVFVRETPPNRMNFSIGKSEPSGEKAATGKRRPRAILLVEVTVQSEDGRTATGFSGDRPSFGWLDKRPDIIPDVKLRMLLDIVEKGRTIYLEHGKPFESAFSLWREASESVARFGRENDYEDLMSSFGSAIFERAIIDACCRLEGKSFFEMVHGNLLGIAPETVHSELKDFNLPLILPQQPRTEFFIRHTVGLSDPIDASEWPSENRVDDGEPETLKEYADRDGLRYFKIKISGAPDHDLKRLEKIWHKVLVHVDSPVVTLDGNEAYTDIKEFATFVKRFEKEVTGLFQHTLFIEQPLTRALTLDPKTAATVAEISLLKPLEIDEADGKTTAFKEAFAIGYSGTSHKNCKGVFKSLLNFGLCVHFATVSNRDAFLTGEDLSNMSIIPLHQDFVTLSVLGIDHCERNGHHYAYGMSHLSQGEKQNLLKQNPDLYEERDGEVFLRIKDGKVKAGSLQSIGFGSGTEPDWSTMPTLESWRKSNEV